MTWFEGNLYRKIGPLFGWAAHNTGMDYPVTDEFGTVIDMVRLKSFWIGEIIHLHHQQPYNELVVMVLETNNWRKGLLLIPPFYKPLDRDVGGPFPAHPIDFDDWQDPFSTLLKAAPLFPSHNHEETQEYTYSCTIEIQHQASGGRFSFLSSLKDDIFGQNLSNTIHSIVKRYHNEEIDNYIQHLTTPPSNLG